MLSFYREMFTVARLIDRESIEKVLNNQPMLAEDGVPCSCAGGAWKLLPCKYCVVTRAFQKKTRQTKLEYLEPDVYQATANYLEIDGKPYVLELIQKLDDEVLIDPESSEELMDKLLPYREKLYRDVVTGAYNRRYYEDNLKKVVQDAGVAVLDFDDLKLCNDAFGHQAGDVALKAATDVVRQNIRKSDVFIRYGGDEFLLFLPNIPKSILNKKLQRICDQVHNAAVPEYPHIQLSVSIGGVLAENESIESAVARADRLMYQAKARKNMVVTEVDSETTPEQTEELRTRQKILLVDDSEMNRAILCEMLGKDYDILEAGNGQDGLELLREYGASISLMLLDIVMPMMDGFEVLNAMAKENLLDDIPVIMISSEDSDDIIRKAYELGVSDYISRPFDAKIVYRRVFNTITLYTKQRRLVSLVTDQIREKEKNNNMMVTILSHIVEFRNGESGAHVLHIRRLTERILKELIRVTNRYPLTADQRELIVMASALHDIGKIAIDEKILNKPGRLTPEEFEVIKTHTVVGAEILDKLNIIYRDEAMVRTAREICRWHHERYDGRGYPDGLKGDEIPISAQVVALADVYDALVSERVYKKAYSHEVAVQMILSGECGAFNPLLLECLEKIAPELPALESSLT